jgi:hypothetical protein
MFAKPLEYQRMILEELNTDPVNADAEKSPELAGIVMDFQSVERPNADSLRLEKMCCKQIGRRVEFWVHVFVN